MKDNRKIVGTRTAHLTARITLRVEVPIKEGQTSEEAINDHREECVETFASGAEGDPEIHSATFIDLEFPF